MNSSRLSGCDGHELLEPPWRTSSMYDHSGFGESGEARPDPLHSTRFTLADAGFPAGPQTMWRNHEYVTIIHDQTEYFIAFGPFTHLDRELHILTGQNSVCVHTVLVSVVRNKHTFVTGTHVLWNHRDTVRRCNTSCSHQCFYYANLMLLSIYVSVFMCVRSCARWPL